MNMDLEFLKKIRNPHNYSGMEINVSRKEFRRENVNICLIFPDRYEIGMSHYGLRLLYRFLNNYPNVNAERAFLPDPESIKVFKEYDHSLISIENKIPLAEFDILSFSVLSELNFTNILQILDLSKIPLKSSEREENFPIIAGGGITIGSNPEPLREYFDFIGIGDGETLYPEVLEIISRQKNGVRFIKLDFLKEISEKEGFYVPALFRISQQKDFMVLNWKGKTIKKSIQKKLDISFTMNNMIVPFANTVFKRLDVEIARGCPHNCRFCQAKPYYSPYRLNEPQKILKYIENGVEITGYDSVSFSTLSSGDYPKLCDLIQRVPDVLPEHVAFSVSSLKPSTVTGELLDYLSAQRKTGITIVPEAGTQRLRDLINKNLNEEEILRAVELAIEKKWQRIKLYFMIGLPYENDQDIEGIIDLLEKIHERFCKKRPKNKINVSFSAFVPKPHTSFQYESRDSLENLIRKREILERGIKKKKSIKYSFHDFYVGIVETILARGDTTIGNMIYDAYKQGEIFSSWLNEFHFEVWDELIRKYEADKFLNRIDKDQVLPWDFIDLYFTREYLKKDLLSIERKKALSNCIDNTCSECISCLFPGKKPVKRQDKGIKTNKTSLESSEICFQKIRIFYKKIDDFKNLPHSVLIELIEKIIRMSRIKCRYTQGFHPRIKMASLNPLPLFAQSEEEVLELYVDDKLNKKQIVTILNSVSVEFKFSRVEICPPNGPNLFKDIKFIDYILNFTISPDQREEILQLIGVNDRIDIKKNKIRLRIFYQERGTERFAGIYRILDPERLNTEKLIRAGIVFKDD
jgi:radical SAM family uncharacterized protein/radical SAM-linked protein